AHLAGDGVWMNRSCAELITLGVGARSSYFACALGAERLRYPAIERSGVHGASLPRDFGAILEEDQRGNSANAVAPAELGTLIRVHFCNLQLRATLAGELVEAGSHHPAGSAPGRPKIHEHRKACTRNVRVERIPIERDRLSGLDGCLALRALGI